LSDQDWRSKPLSEVVFLTDLDNADYYVAGAGSTDSTNENIGGNIDEGKDLEAKAENSKVQHLNRTVSSTCSIPYGHSNTVE
jgi:hypothetical protein